MAGADMMGCVMLLGLQHGYTGTAGKGKLLKLSDCRQRRDVCFA